MDLLHAKTSDPAILALWEAGLSRWGYAFVAFTSLKGEALFTPDCLRSFEELYVISMASVDAVIDEHLEGMGWATPLQELRDEWMIPKTMLDFNRGEVLAGFKEFMDVVEEGGEAHVFLR